MRAHFGTGRRDSRRGGSAGAPHKTHKSCAHFLEVGSLTTREPKLGFTPRLASQWRNMRLLHAVVRKAIAMFSKATVLALVTIAAAAGCSGADSSTENASSAALASEIPTSGEQVIAVRASEQGRTSQWSRYALEVHANGDVVSTSARIQGAAPQSVQLIGHLEPAIVRGIKALSAEIVASELVAVDPNAKDCEDTPTHPTNRVRWSVVNSHNELVTVAGENHVGQRIATDRDTCRPIRRADGKQYDQLKNALNGLDELRQLSR
jgi:hypothetical protein